VEEDDEREIVAAMREAIAKARGYADYFGWAPNRDLEEWGVVQSLKEAFEREGRPFRYQQLKVRGRSNDPPDCEAQDEAGRRIAIEVTELVDAEAICAFKAGRVYEWANWTKETFLSSLTRIIGRKDARFPCLKEPPYEGGYELIVFTDEPMLSRERVEAWLPATIFRTNHLSRVILLLGYDPGISGCSTFELDLGS